MNNTKLGTLQAASVIITVMISHIILNMPNHLISSVGSATILNLVYIFIITLLVFYIASKIFDHFPGKDLIDICEFTGGRFLKNAYSILICLYFLIISGFVIRTFSESLVLIYFQNIDIEIVVLIFVIIATIMNIFGFKTISRVALITLPAILIRNDSYLYIIFFKFHSSKSFSCVWIWSIRHFRIWSWESICIQ